MCLSAASHDSPISLAWYLLVCRIVVPNILEGLKQIQLSRTYSSSSWVVVKQNALCEANMVTNKALDLVGHRLYIFVVFCCVGSICSKPVMCLSSSHMILCSFFICNKCHNSKYIYIVTYCFIRLWKLIKKKKKKGLSPSQRCTCKGFLCS